MTEKRRLTKRYRPETAANGLDFTVRPGIVTGFPGSNGKASPPPCALSSARTRAGLGVFCALMAAGLIARFSPHRADA